MDDNVISSGARSGRRSILLQVNLGHMRVLQFFDQEKNSDICEETIALFAWLISYD